MQLIEAFRTAGDATDETTGIEPATTGRSFASFVYITAWVTREEADGRIAH